MDNRKQSNANHNLPFTGVVVRTAASATDNKVKPNQHVNPSNKSIFIILVN